MSELFVAAHNPDIRLSHMASGRAAIFIALTEVAVKIYEVSLPPITRNMEEDWYEIHAEPFCLLVERVFDQPINLLYVWASYAAGIYQHLKGERYTWLWGGGSVGAEDQYKAILLQCTGYAFAPDTVPTDKVIGPRWYSPDLQT